MDSREIESPAEADYTAAVPLEIDEETANRADDLLREFAEDAGLETALIVDRSGALVAGISAEAEVTVEVISALVAGASGAMRALVSRLGETGAVESLHLGGNRLVYLKEIVNRFILVAVAEVSQPAGLVRQKAIAIEPRLDALLHEIKPPETAPSAPAPAVRSLRAIARERAALREAGLAAAAVAPLVEADEEIDASAIDEDEIHVEEHESVQVEEIVVAEFPEEVPVEESFETLECLAEEEEASVAAESPESPADPFEPEEEATAGEPEESHFSPFVPTGEDEDTDVIPATPAVGTEGEAEIEVEAEAEGIELPDLLESEPAPEPVPREILEPIDFGEPEIVIESSLPPVTPPSPRITLPVDSPFEAEDDEEEELAISLSHENEANVFEVEEEEAFEIDPEDSEEDEEPELVSLLPDPPVPPASLFEFADEEDDFEDFLIEDEPESAGDSAAVGPAPTFPDYVARRPTSLFEMAGDEDLEDDFAPFTVDEEEEEDADEGGEMAAPSAIFEADDDDEDLLDDVPAHLTPVPPEPEAKTGTSGELEEMIAEEEEEEQIRSAGPFYF